MEDCTCDEFCCQCGRKLYVTRWYISGAPYGRGGPFCSQRCMNASRDGVTSPFQNLSTGSDSAMTPPGDARRMRRG